MTKSSVESEPDVPLLGVAAGFLFLCAVSQVFPAAWRAPWSFNGWFSPVLSLASWVVGGFATVGIVMTFVSQERKPLFTMPLELLGVMTGWGLVFVALVASVHFVSAQGSPASVVADDPLESRVEKLCERQEKLGALISDLEAERSAIVRQIRLGNTPALDGHELLEIDRSLKQLKREAEEVALTVSKGESLLRQTDRQKRLRESGINSKDLDELSALRVEIEDRLKSGSVPRSAGDVIQIDGVVRDAVRLNR